MSGKFAGLALETEKPSRLFLKDPRTEKPLVAADGTPAWIDVLSGDSDAARRHDREVARRRLGKRNRQKIEPEEIEADRIGLLVAITAGWRLIGLDGNPIDEPCTPAGARELYTEPAMAWLRDQVDEFAADRANFSKASSTS